MSNPIIAMTGSINFGDAIADIVYEKLSNKKIVVTNIRSKDIHYLTAGSVLALLNKNSIIMGTGSMDEMDDIGKGSWKNGFKNKVYNKPHKILSVRGPKTRQKLINMGIDCPEKYGDPLIILPLVYFKQIDKLFDIGIIPHYIDQKCKKLVDLQNLLKNYGNSVTIINGIKCGKNFEPFIDKILECEYIISSSLHGVIMGLVYGKKTIFYPFSNNVVGSNFKFFDFFESVEINYKVYQNIDPKNLSNFIIKIDKNKLINIGTSIINVCPFIEEKRKNDLVSQWQNHCKNF